MSDKLQPPFDAKAFVEQGSNQTNPKLREIDFAYRAFQLGRAGATPAEGNYRDGVTKQIEPSGELYPCDCQNNPHHFQCNSIRKAYTTHVAIGNERSGNCVECGHSLVETHDETGCHWRQQGAVRNCKCQIKIQTQPAAPDWADAEAREYLDANLGRATDTGIAALLRRVVEQNEKRNRDAIDAHLRDYPNKGACEWNCRTMAGFNEFEAKVVERQRVTDEQFKAIAKELGDNGYCSYVAVEDVLRKHLLAAAIRKGKK